MGVADKLLRAAGEIAETYHAQVHNLNAEREKEQAKLAAMDAVLIAAQLAPKRLATFVVTDGIEYYCPKCWIRDNAKATLRGVPSDGRNDYMRCNKCGSDFAV